MLLINEQLHVYCVVVDTRIWVYKTRVHSSGINYATIIMQHSHKSTALHVLYIIHAVQ